MSASEIQKIRVINELRGFIKKLLQEPQILERSLTSLVDTMATPEPTMP